MAWATLMPPLQLLNKATLDLSIIVCLLSTQSGHELVHPKTQPHNT